MPLGLPNHLTADTALDAFALAARRIAVTCILITYVVLASFQAAEPSRALWPGFLALAPFFPLIYVPMLGHRRLRTIAYLVVGGASLYWFAIVGMYEFVQVSTSASFFFSIPKLALVFVGAGRSAHGIAGWAVAGYLAGEAAVDAAMLQTGGQIAFDPTTSIALLIVLLGIASVNRGQARSIAAQPGFVRAAREERVATTRRQLEAKAAAVVHDTVLGDLAALASARPGRLAPELVSAVERDLDVLVGSEWLVVDADAHLGDWSLTPLARAIEEVRDLGLDVDLSGDVDLVASLPADRAVALGAAAKQCLVNVLRHAGVVDAELVVYGADDQVTVMIVDSGRGFVVGAAPADRLGLRQSVLQRIESVGGRAQLFSSPGRGTSVLLTVPRTGGS